MTMGRVGCYFRSAIVVLHALASFSCTSNPNEEPIEVVGAVNDTEFLANEFFFLDRPDSVFSSTAFRPDPSRLNVFIEDFLPMDPQGDVQFAAYALADTLGNGLDDGPDGEVSQLISVELLSPGVDYIPLLDEAGIFRGIRLKVHLSESSVLAASYVAVDNNGNEIFVGDFDIAEANDWFSDLPDTLQLELIKPEEFHPESPTWSYMMRHIYSLGGESIDYSTLEISIVRWAVGDPTHPEDSNLPYTRIFGLDQFDSDLGLPGQDGKVDLARIDTEEGLLAFPVLHAFDPPESLVCVWTTVVEEDTTCYELLLEDRNQAPYSTHHTQLLHDPVYVKYRIEYHWFSN